MDKSNEVVEKACGACNDFERDEEMTHHWKEKNDYLVMSEIEEREGKPFDEVVEEARRQYDEKRNKGTKETHRPQSELVEIHAIMEEVAHDPEATQAMAEAQRELGTLTPEELRRHFTI